MTLKKYLALFLLCCLWQSPAYAKGVPIINTGDEIFEIGAFPTALNSAYPELEQLKAGYKCNHFGLFWADVWTWDCTLVAITSIDDNSYYELPPEILTILQNDPNYKMNKAQRSFWNNYGIVILILLLVAYLAFQKLSNRQQNNNES